MARTQRFARALATTALVLTLSVASAACGFFTPAREAEIVDIGCVILHYELPDSELAQLCHLPVAQVPAARSQALSAASAAIERPAVTQLALSRDAGADQ